MNSRFLKQVLSGVLAYAALSLPVGAYAEDVQAPNAPAEHGMAAAPVVAASVGGLCDRPELEKLPILAEGRVMPFFVHAQRVRKELFPKNTCPSLSAPALYCYLSTGQVKKAETLGACTLGSLKVDHVKSFELLALPSDAKLVPANWVREKKEEIYSAYQAMEAKGEQNSGFAVDLGNLMNRLSTHESIEHGADWTVAVGEGKWKSIAELQAEGRADLEELVLKSSTQVTADEKASLKWETIYERVHPFGIAVLICLVGFLISVLAVRSAKFDRLALGIAATLLAVEIFGLVARILISGRAPVTNMYETVLWTGLGIFFLSIVIGFGMKERRVWAVGFAGNAVCLMMMMFATSMLDGSIKPLVPVLRDNFWLSTHVMTITFAYACLALSWLIANYTLIRWLLKPAAAESKKRVEHWNQVNRLAVQIGSVFLAAGIILGGVWADYSWGRFWGWDPKETWSLIALIIYMVILHGRYVGWFKGVGFAQVTGAGFLFVLMAWFGVNYILASGLHSYGFSSGGATYLGITFVTQLVILGITGLRVLQMKAGDGATAQATAPKV